MLNAETIRGLLEYNPSTGALAWKERDASMFGDDQRICNSWNTKYANKPALAFKDNKGYFRGRIFGKGYLAHRVVWVIVHGEWPQQEIDHINGDKADNRIENLRDVSRIDNVRNVKWNRRNKSGAIGVCYHPSKRGWVATIGKGDGLENLGYIQILMKQSRQGSEPSSATAIMKTTPRAAGTEIV